jgi:aromatase
MIVHTLLYRFPESASEEDVSGFFTAMRELVLGTGLVEGFDVRPHLLLGADKGARGMTAQWVVQFTCADLSVLDRFSQLPAVFDFVTDWKSRLNFEAAYANHEQLDLVPVAA